MRILVVTPTFPSADSPAEGVFNEQHAHALADAGGSVTVVVCKPWIPISIARRWNRYRSLVYLPRAERRGNVDVGYARYLHMPGYKCVRWTISSCSRGVLASIRRAREPKFDVLHVHGAWPIGLASPVIACRSGLPVVITFHIQDDRRLLSGSAGSKLYERMLHHAAALVVVGSPLERFLSNLAHRTIEPKLHRIPNGVDLDEIGEVLEDLRGQGPEWQSIVSVGNLWPVKGIDLNLYALARLAERQIPWFRYTIIGDGPERPALERLSDELGLSARVEFKGKLPHRAVLREVARAGIFSLPSWQESFGAAHLEAMACGRPVIGCRTQGIEDMIEHRKEGLLVEPKSVEALSGALEMLLTHPETAREMGRAGQSVARKFTWPRIAGRYMSLYRSLTDE